jgi:AcrR family transcriptional regulator
MNVYSDYCARMEEQISYKKEAIYNATLELITSRGFDSTPMSMIAKRAGVAAGTIYIYFKSKEEIITQLYLKTKTELTEYITKSVNIEQSSRRSLASIVKNYLQFMIENPQKFKYLEQYYNSPYFDKMIQSECMKIFEPMIIFIQKSIEEKHIKNLGMNMIHSFVFSPMNNLINLHLRGEFEINDISIELICNTVWDSLKV